MIKIIEVRISYYGKDFFKNKIVHSNIEYKKNNSYTMEGTPNILHSLDENIDALVYR